MNINEIICDSINKKIPISIGKIGSVEATAMYLYDRYNNPELSLNTIGHGWTIKEALEKQAGVYPLTPENYIKWYKLYLHSLKDMDYLLQWCPEYGDSYIINKFCKETTIFTEWIGYEPWFLEEPTSWIKELNDKKLLVISPFKKTIEKQSKIFDKIWPGYKVIPEVQVIKTPFSFEKDNKYNSYFSALNDIIEQINNIDFDFAILGCGSYAIPLMSYIKKLEKPSIHLGGSTQILFGIKGKRWDNKENYLNSNFYNNKYWTRSLPEDIPENSNMIENGCYW